jgi:NADH-quinone oxidoreductase subunit C
MTEISAQTIEEVLKDIFPGKILQVEHPYNFMTITIAHEAILPVIKYLYEHEGFQFTFLTSCCGMHFPEASQRFGMVYHLHSLVHNFRLRLKAYTNDEHPVFPSLTGVFKAANWMEREAFDFFGFRFTGHPDLRRILNMDNLEGWPLRKEFPLEDPFRRDKDDKMFGR